MRKALFLALVLSTAFAACDKSNDPKVVPQPEAKITINGVTDMTAPKGSKVIAVLAITTTSAQEKTDLSVTGLPNGATAGFDPASGTPNFSSTLTIEVGENVATGVYPIKIVGKTATGSKSYDANLSVNESKITINGLKDLTLYKGSTVMTELEITTTATEENTDLSVTGLPSGVWAEFDPESGIPGFTTTLTLESNSGAAIGVYPIKIIAKTATATRSYNVNLTVKEACDIFIGKYTATYEWTGPAVAPNTIEIKASTAGKVNISDLFYGSTLSWDANCIAKTIDFANTISITGGPLHGYDMYGGNGTFSATGAVLYTNINYNGTIENMKITLERQ